ncbi:exosortase family protein XrtF [Flavobacterium sp.]|uniref:exosortase family protein XrtF n=1 Tax=Flavobacterium sp. TaxID=239 RepID=UPI002B4B03B9|nr:exosortase family protein XrtF [Flavobacterium sp.]HLF52216.1 exosortase family protein XrtF [Flavobacterium sp.]
MKNYWIQYKPFLLFLGKFALTYLVLTIIYQGYLNQFDEKTFEVDGFTQLVAKQTEQTLLFFNGDANTELHPSQPNVKLFYNQKYVARIIEGCNALSVIILFVAFVVAFTGKLKHTLLYIIGGSLLIHVLNIARIALLAVALYHFPNQEPVLHGVVFPLFIYGIVFILWVIWVNKFSLYAKKTAK